MPTTVVLWRAVQTCVLIEAYMCFSLFCFLFHHRYDLCADLTVLFEFLSRTKHILPDLFLHIRAYRK